MRHTLVFGMLATFLAGCEAGNVQSGPNTGYSSMSAPLTVGGHHCPTSGEIAGRDVPSDNAYYLTTFGGGGDTQRMSCGGSADATWYYVADKWRFGCGAHVRITNPATGASCVAQVADVGPNICVEQAAGRPVIDASPLVSLALFHVHEAGWSDRRDIVAELVDNTTPLGCDDGSGSTGTGMGTTCASGQTRCGTSCVDVQSDIRNCGACGHACDAGSTCDGGMCNAGTDTGSCPSGQLDCGSGCIDVQSDMRNCGACHNACDAGVACMGGACGGTGTTGTGTSGCDGTLTTCSGACVDLQSDLANCGSCDNACGAGMSCTSGACVMDGTTDGSTTTMPGDTCDASLESCTGLCVDLSTDPANCGACGNACDSWTQTCYAGSCIAAY